ncbi:MAG: flagellar basal body-associated FliL family protein [Deltaproteobacteria bacterium]|nr:flagellar basal body-associated FliL family protein [Deltaproteobacteria bacterium]
MSQESEQQSATPANASISKPRKFKKILLLAGLTLFLTVGGGLAYLMLTDDPTETPAKAAARPYEVKAIMPLEPFLVNLADQEIRRYLKIKVELDIDQENAVKELEKFLPPIRDALILLLSSKTFAEIGSVEGKHQLKQDIMRKLAAVPGGEHVKGVYFTEFVAQ